MKKLLVVVFALIASSLTLCAQEQDLIESQQISVDENLTAADLAREEEEVKAILNEMTENPDFAFNEDEPQ